MAEIIMRPYQAEAVEAAVMHVERKGKPAILVLPTGSGKSIVIANIARRLAGNTLIFQPSKEILEQNFNKLVSYDPFLPVAIYSASFNSKKMSKLTFAMIGSVINKKELFTHFDNILIDECHLVNPKGGMYDEFLEHLGETKNIIGLTATPYRLATNSFGSELRFITRTRPSIFKSVLYHSQVSDLAAYGFLAKMNYYQIKGFDSKQVKSNSTGADYDERSLQQYLKKIQFDNSLLGVATRLIEKRKNLLVFTKFTDEARYLVKELQVGDAAAIVTAETKQKERAQILEGFKSGKILVVANVGVLTTGFDFPELECVLLARPTKSLALYYQMVGRGMRPHKDKESCWVVDMCENYNRFGKVEDLKMECEKANMWSIKSNGRQLTNVILD
jgi:DNA repair protein RadD